jgi:hypothetical protein
MTHDGSDMFLFSRWASVGAVVGMLIMFKVCR